MRKKKIDSVVDLCQEVEEVNRLFETLLKKSAPLQEKIEKLESESWLTDEDVIFRKKVAIKSIFSVSLPDGLIKKKFIISSLNISYVAETNIELGENYGMVGVYLVLSLKNKAGSRIDIGIAASEDCKALSDVRFDELRLRAYWEFDTFEFSSLEDFKTVVTFCKEAIDAVNEKLAAANLEKMTLVIYA